MRGEERKGFNGLHKVERVSGCEERSGVGINRDGRTRMLEA